MLINQTNQQMATNQNIIRCEQDGVEFFTVQETGESGMSISGLARLSGVGHNAVLNLLKSLVTSSCPEFLKPLQGKELTLVTSLREHKNATILKDEVCAMILEWYAFETQRPTEAAKYSYRQFSKAGVRSWIQGITGWQQVPQPQQLSWFNDRLKTFRRRTKIPSGYFCIFEEVISLVADLEDAGCILPNSVVPDISVGKCFCNQLRKDGFDMSQIDSYPHFYPGRSFAVDANIYPVEWLPKFRMWFEDTYKPLKSIAYFQRSHPQALPSLAKVLGLPEAQ